MRWFWPTKSKNCMVAPCKNAQLYISVDSHGYHKLYISNSCIEGTRVPISYYTVIIVDTCMANLLMMYILVRVHYTYGFTELDTAKAC